MTPHETEKRIFIVECIVLLLLVGITIYLSICHSILEKLNICDQSCIVKKTGYLIGIVFSIIIIIIIAVICYNQSKRF